MTDYRLWGRVEQIAPDQFIAIVSAVPDRSESEAGDCDVRLQLLPQRTSAKAVLDNLIVALGDAVIRRGDRVVDVEVDD